MTEPMGLTVGGPNGAGKTLLAEPYAEQKSMPYLAADRTSFVVESALDGRGIARRVDRTNEADRTHEAGYETRIAFVVLDSVDLCVVACRSASWLFCVRRGCPSAVHAEQDELLDIVPPEGEPVAPPVER